MFTGIIQGIGQVSHFQGSRLEIQTLDAWPNDPIAAGESVAVNGCCLTALEDGTLYFDLSPETRLRTAFHQVHVGSRVNLERAMRPTDRFGGHIVQGHVDTVAEVVAILQDGEFTVFRFRIPNEFDKYLIGKGSVTVNGISLTVVNPVSGEFDVWIVPHTLKETTLGDLKPSEVVNVEFDVLAKHLEKLMSSE